MQITDNDILQAIDDHNFKNPAVLNNGQVKFNFFMKKEAKKYIDEFLKSNFIKSFTVEQPGSQIWVTVDKYDLYLYLEV